MKNTSNQAVIFLLLSAVILGGLVLIFDQTQQPAQAESMARGGEYIMIVSSFNENIDMVHVIDISAQAMNTYAINNQRKRIERVDGTNLRQLFGVPRR